MAFARGEIGAQAFLETARPEKLVEESTAPEILGIEQHARRGGAAETQRREGARGRIERRPLFVVGALQCGLGEHACGGNNVGFRRRRVERDERGRRAVKLLGKQAERPFEPTGIDDAVVERS